VLGHIPFLVYEPIGEPCQFVGHIVGGIPRCRLSIPYRSRTGCLDRSYCRRANRWLSAIDHISVTPGNPVRLMEAKNATLTAPSYF
jgi:hypothetical protein